MCMQIMEGPWWPGVKDKKQDNWPKGNKDPEELTHISGLNHPSGLLTHKDTHTRAPLGEYYYFASAFDVCSPACCTVFLTMNFIPV